MAIVFMTDPLTGRCAIFEENGTTGDPDNPNSTRNAPLNNPNANLSRIYFHSDLDYCEVSHGPTTVTVTHASVSSGSDPATGVGWSNKLVYGAYSIDRNLLTHNLGYVPDFLVISNDDIVYGGTPVQYASDGRTRNVTVYATSTQIRMHETAVRTSSTLSSVSRDYTVIVFRQPPSPIGNILIDWNPTSEVLTMGKEKFKSDRRYLQVVASGSTFGFARGRTIDLSNGAVRFVDPDLSITDVVPPGTAMYFAMSTQPTGSIELGPSFAYDGSFAGTAGIQFQVP